MQPTDPLLTAREGAAYLQVAIATFWRRVADGTIPKPVKLGQLSRWPQSEIIDVIERAKARRFLGNPQATPHSVMPLADGSSAEPRT